MYDFTAKQVANLRRGTRGVLLFGIVTSISANVLHSLTRPEAASEPTWKLLSAAALAALAPLVLFACTELVSRIPVHSRVLAIARSHYLWCGVARYATISASIALPFTLAKAFAPVAGAALAPSVS